MAPSNHQQVNLLPLSGATGNCGNGKLKQSKLDANEC